MSSSPSTGATEYRATYRLPEPFHSKKLENSSSIMFDAEYNDKDSYYEIKGFTITVTAENEADMLGQTDIQAERLVQIMTLKSLGYVQYTYDGYCYKTSRCTWMVIKSFVARYHIRGMIDELNLNSNQKISSIMQNDEPTNLQLYHFRLAIEAEENRQYASIYRELFQVIEKDGELRQLGQFGDEYDKYKSLRAAISHQKKLDSAPTKVKDYFKGRYDFVNGEFDHNSNKNRQHLKEDAEALKKIVINYLTKKLQ
jgi:hypothetical protein